MNNKKSNFFIIQYIFRFYSYVNLFGLVSTSRLSWHFRCCILQPMSSVIHIGELLGIRTWTFDSICACVFSFQCQVEFIVRSEYPSYSPVDSLHLSFLYPSWYENAHFVSFLLTPIIFIGLDLFRKRPITLPIYIYLSLSLFKLNTH